MTYDGSQIANYILDFCQQRNRPVTNLSLQKIIYFCHVWSLVNLDKPLVRHNFEAWEFGPVLQYLYHEFKDFDRSPISSRAQKIDVVRGVRETVNYDFDQETELLLGRVVDFYSRLSAGDLVELSHAADGPWAKVWHHSGIVKLGMKIEDTEIKRYYSKANNDYENLGRSQRHLTAE